MNGVITAVVYKGEQRAKSGFGFILDEDKQERFFHATNLPSGVVFDKNLEGKRVTFDPVEIPGKGLRAQNVVPA